MAMSKISEKLIDSSIQAALSAIEIYKKPDFKYREQAFAILILNAWELLLKAKILSENHEDIESIYVIKDGQFKTNRSRNPMTKEIIECMRICSMNDAVVKNLEQLIDIRDTAVHYYHDDALNYIIYILGVATLRNYQKLVKDWFGRSLLEYNFYILPLAFAYNFQTLSIIDVDTKPDLISNIIKSVVDEQQSREDDGDFHFVCEVKTTIVSAKKVSESTDFTAKIDQNANAPIIVERLQRITDKYTLTYREMWEKIKKLKPYIKQATFNQIIKEHGLKTNRQFSDYNFTSKAHQIRFEKDGVLPKGITVIYNEDALRYILEHLG
jgi:hypothetical protein